MSDEPGTYDEKLYRKPLTNGCWPNSNPNEDESIQFMLLGIPIEGKKDTFEIHGVTNLSKKGKEPKGCRMPFGEMEATEIFNAMNLDVNVDFFLEYFMESAKMIYSGNLPSIY